MHEVQIMKALATHSAFIYPACGGEEHLRETRDPWVVFCLTGIHAAVSVSVLPLVF